jgi:hypothetical protein
MSMAMLRQKKHISLIIHKKEIIAIGQNEYKTHPQSVKLGYKYPEMHSELDAFRKVPRSMRDKKLILLNFRFNRFGNYRNAKPCPVCSKWCKDIFHDIYYTTDDGIICLDD